jgi:hypothetical protein
MPQRIVCINRVLCISILKDTTSIWAISLRIFLLEMAVDSTHPAINMMVCGSTVRGMAMAFFPGLTAVVVIVVSGRTVCR